jgi:hypothetical protein
VKQQSEIPVQVDMAQLEASLEKRLQARAARADSAVELNPSTLNRWLQEELAALMQELARMHALANGAVLN